MEPTNVTNTFANNFGTTGWSKFGTPMLGGTRATQMIEFNTAFDNLVAVVKKYGNGAPAQYLSAFNVDSVKLHAIGELIIDGKATI